MPPLISESQQVVNYPRDDFRNFIFGEFQIIERIGCGTNDIVYLVNLGDSEGLFVLKRSILNFRREQFLQEIVHYFNMQNYIGGEYIPPALFVWDTQNKVGGHSGYCITQYYPEFKALKDLSDEEYFALHDQLVEIVSGMIEMMEETGEIVDFSGNKGSIFLNLVIFRKSENVVVIYIDGIPHVIVLDFGRGNVLARIPFLKDLIRTMFIFGLNRALKELNNYADS